MSAKDSLTYPGVFASLEDARTAQRAAARYANESSKGETLHPDQRWQVVLHEYELRSRVLLRSAVLWAVVGIPMIMTVATIALYLLNGWLLSKAIEP